MLPTKSLDYKSPLEVLYKIKPDYSSLKVFGSTCYSYLRPFNKHKLQYRSQHCTFLGYYHQYKGYKYLDSSGRVYISRHVVFDESVYTFALKLSSHSYSKVNSFLESSSHSTSPVIPQDFPPRPHSSIQ